MRGIFTAETDNDFGVEAGANEPNGRPYAPKVIGIFATVPCNELDKV
jgi:hypothetical protein